MSFEAKTFIFLLLLLLLLSSRLTYQKMMMRQTNFFFFSIQLMSRVGNSEQSVGASECVRERQCVGGSMRVKESTHKWVCVCVREREWESEGTSIPIIVLAASCGEISLCSPSLFVFGENERNVKRQTKAGLKLKWNGRQIRGPAVSRNGNGAGGGEQSRSVSGVPGSSPFTNYQF